MEATVKRNIQSGTEYDFLFPKPKLENIVIKSEADLQDTISLIPKVIRQTQNQTYKLAWEKLRANSLQETCQRIWDFVYEHIAYKKDEAGKEQVRSPARAWHDRFNGVDCDCYSVFISSILCNLGIPHVLRITKYSKPFFQHIYPVVTPPGGKEIVLDCVTEYFDYEVPFTDKKDISMQLQFLNGIDGDESINGDEFIGSMGDEFQGYEEMGDLLGDDLEGNWEGSEALGKIRLKKAKKAAPSPNKPLPRPNILTQRFQATVQNSASQSASSVQPSVQPPAAPKKKKKKGLAKLVKNVGKAVKTVAKTAGKVAKNVGTAVVKAVQRFNPISLITRAAIMVAMKLNIKNIAGRVKYGYLTEAQARAMGMNIDKWKKMVKLKDKIEGIAKAAGAKNGSVAKAIKSGKGNKINPLNFASLSGIDDDLGDVGYEMNPNLLHHQMSVSEILGPGLYHSEFIEGFEGLDGYDEYEGFNELGEVVTLTAIATFLTKFAGPILNILKGIGDIFDGKGKHSTSFNESLENDSQFNPSDHELTAEVDKAQKEMASEPAPVPSSTASQAAAPSATSSSSAAADSDTPASNNLPTPPEPQMMPAPKNSNDVATRQNMFDDSEGGSTESGSDSPPASNSNTSIAKFADFTPTDTTNTNTGNNNPPKDKSFLEKNWPWLVGGAVVLGGAIYFATKNNHKGKNLSGVDRNGSQKRKKPRTTLKNKKGETIMVF